MYIPDLFGAYIKGRELAIEKNWQDLRNYEAIESARNQNDLQALQILGERADFGGKRSMFQDQVGSSKRANEVAEYAQSGMVSRADLGSMFAQDQRSVYLNSRPTAQQVMQQMFDANLGKQGVAAGVQSATNAYWTPERQYNAGQAQGQFGYNTAMANGVASTDFVPAAQRQIAQNQANHGVNMATAQYQLGEVNNDIADQPAMHELGRTRISNEQWQQDNLIGQHQDTQRAAQQNIINEAYREYISYLRAAQAGDQVAAQAASRLAQQYGFDQFNQTVGGSPTNLISVRNGVPNNFIGMGPIIADRNTLSVHNGTGEYVLPPVSAAAVTQPIASTPESPAVISPATAGAYSMLGPIAPFVVENYAPVVRLPTDRLERPIVISPSNVGAMSMMGTVAPLVVENYTPRN